VLGSDHAPHTREEKSRPYPQSPSGMPGRPDHAACHADPCGGRAGSRSSGWWTSPAQGAQRIFNIAGKGRLAEGYDADLTIVDLGARRTLRHSRHGQPLRLDPLRRLRSPGWPIATVIRGRIVMRDDDVVAEGLGVPVRFGETLAAA
jgi:dihydroorotase